MLSEKPSSNPSSKPLSNPSDAPSLLLLLMPSQQPSTISSSKPSSANMPPSEPYLLDAVPPAIFKAVSGTFPDAFDQAIDLQPAFSGPFRNAFAGIVKVRATFGDPIVRTFAGSLGRLSESIVSAIFQTFSDPTLVNS
jgi:hypothetical protein